LYIATASIKLPLAVANKRASSSELRITLPPFIVRVLERRAKDRNLTMSALIEESILDGIMLDEVQRMAEESPDFARIARMWIRSERTKEHGAG
jgi:hypothetical protein